jgi:transposase-like protein
MKQLHEFGSLIEVFKAFSDEKRCLEYLKQLRWKDGIKTCPRCQSEKIYSFKDGKRYSCGNCLKQFTIKVGTIFEGSKLELSKWFAAIYLITSRKKGISSVQLAKDLDVTQKTSWFLLHRIRAAMRQEYFTMIETIAEVDETYVGGKEKNKAKKKRVEGNQGRSTKTRTPIVGILERGKGVRAKKIENASRTELHEFIMYNVFPKSKLMSDEWRGYNGLSKIFNHQRVKHKNEEYVRGECHTNGIEGFWSLLKRGVIGIYHSMSRKHLDRYIDEFVYRYNTIYLSDIDRFLKAFGKIDFRLKYEDLIAE